ncbi:MAG: hypothetical protein KC503_28935, partial [Myxococcales bacterium]|nr:hypothetical protein [Myxococcales bacterium]
PLSTACWFDGYRDREPNEANPWPTARTFLLTTGWRRGRGGRFSVNDIPGKRASPTAKREARAYGAT